ncbi:HEAT repeat domain-containing protein [Petrotoga sp. 9PWA.NaAc.5.4]|uniref:HEAT repeat domain-containing protein n=1 Tax=Petrotoga sp. 9PWA.NaAc.5.4 TaxID=1434328 RepID=UPI000CCAE326|nr:HEAT repeat domain-containing protein [Petrotoga sp. 9PWA.NaAc.5.4]PNR94147.1 hypothetical protein X924_06925 [Petrotoga sp. 9PWA.NaAc.5.4]
MANEIIESYKILEERIKSENVQIYYEMLNSPYPAFKSKAIQELTKHKIEISIVKDYLQDPDKDVRFYAYKYLDKMALLDEETVKTALNDISSAIRKEAIVSYISMKIEPLNFILKYSKDPDPNVRYQLLCMFLEFCPEESNEIIDLMKEDPYVKIRQLIFALDNISETLIDTNIENSVKLMALRRFYAVSDSISFFNSLKEIYFECDDQVKNLIVKFFSGLPCEVINKFIEKVINEENNLEVLQNAAKTLKKVCGIDNLPSFLIDRFINSENTKLIRFGLKLAAEKEDMGYIEFSRNLLNKIDDDLVIGAADYLLSFQDYTLTDYINDFMNSVSSKRIKEGLKIIKKMKLNNFLNEISEIAAKKIYPVSIRKAAVNLLKFFNAKEYWEIPHRILKDPYENGSLKLSALNALLRLNAEMVVNF